MTTDPTLLAGGGARKDAIRRAMRFGALSSAILFAIIIALGFASRLEVFNAGFHVGFALVLGVAGTILLGVGLMALSFYSDRSGADDAVRGMGEDDSTRPGPTED